MGDAMNFQNIFERLTGKLVGWMDALILMLPNIVGALAVIVIFFLLAKLVRRGAARVLSGMFADRPALNSVVAAALSFAMTTIGLLFALNVLHLEKAVFSLLAGVGVLGLALGLAFQSIASNLMSGFLIMIRRPFRIGDTIESLGHLGVVQEITLRVTILEQPSGELMLLPNKEVYEKPLTRYVPELGRRVEVPVGVSYGDDLERAQALACEAVERLASPGGIRDVEAFFTEFGSSSINFVLWFWIDDVSPHALHAARSAAVIAIKRAFADGGITIPFPIRTLDFGIKGGRTLADVARELPHLNSSG
jgi:small conductance mechanosensitive channel